jgi:hypothetical protein
MRVTRDARVPPAGLALLCLGAWAVPGGAHLWMRQWGKGLVLLVSLSAMFTTGIALHGRLFPFELSQPLVALAACADLGIGLPYFLARALGHGAGQVTAVTYEYANAFIIVAGLLNLLVVLDAYDSALGRKAATVGKRTR